MTRRNDPQHADADGQSNPRPLVGCLGNGCGDFGFIEDVSMLVALKILVDDFDFEDHSSTVAVQGADVALPPELHFTDLHEHVAGRSGSDLIY